MITSSDQLVPVPVINETTKKISLRDDTDYAGLGQSLTGFKSIGTLSGPLGVITEATFSVPFIDLDGSTVSSDYDMPFDVDGKLLDGTYTLSYKFTDDTTTFTKEVSWCYKRQDYCSFVVSHSKKLGILSFEDTTDLTNIVLTSKKYVFQFPNGADGSPVKDDVIVEGVNSSKTYTITSLYSNTYTVSVTIAGTYSYSNYEVVFSHSCLKEHVVSYNSSLSVVKGCLSNMIDLYEKQCKMGGPSSALECDLSLIQSKYVLAQLYDADGDEDLYSEVVDEIVLIAKRNGCSCSSLSGSEPALIIGDSSINVLPPGSVIHYAHTCENTVKFDDFKIVGGLLADGDLVSLEGRLRVSSGTPTFIVSVDGLVVMSVDLSVGSDNHTLVMERSGTSLKVAYSNSDVGALELSTTSGFDFSVSNLVSFNTMANVSGASRQRVLHQRKL